MADETTSKTISYAEAKAFADRIRGMSPEDVQAAFKERYDEIKRCLRMGFSEDDAVYSTVMNMNMTLYMD